MSRFFFIAVISFLILTQQIFAQPQLNKSLFYQTVVRDSNRDPLIAQNVNIKFKICSGQNCSNLQWEETHNLSTDSSGMVICLVGQGQSTGGGTVSGFSQINWLDSGLIIKVYLDIGVTGVYSLYGENEIFSLPYALYSDTTLSIRTLKLDSLLDVEVVTAQVNDLIFFDGTNWNNGPVIFSDSCFFSYNSANAINSDSALYTWNCLIDTVLFSQRTDSSIVVFNSNYSDSTYFSSSSGLSQFANLSQVYYWIDDGNMAPVSNTIGTQDMIDVVVKTNSQPRFVIHNNGVISYNTNLDSANINMFISDALLHEGRVNLDSFYYDTTLLTQLVWSPGKSSFLAETNAQWDTLQVGLYSIGFGLNNNIGNYSLVSGSESSAIGDNAIVFGRKCVASAQGASGFGTCISMGDSCVTTGVRTVCMGKGNYTTNTTAVAIGEGANGLGNVTTAIGYHVTAQGNFSTAIGSYVNSGNKLGGFIWGDHSTSTFLTPSSNYMFVLRADGGVILFTDALQTMGVTLFSGAGSWSSISDSTKKRDLVLMNEDYVLQKIKSVPVYYWEYISQPGVYHIGPMAQDFYEAFLLGESEIYITSSDIDGVIMLAIIGVNERLDQIIHEYNSIDQQKIDELIHMQSIQNDRLNLIEKILNIK